jgi:hypothetical protein
MQTRGVKQNELVILRINETNLNNGLIETADENAPLNHFLFH